MPQILIVDDEPAIRFGINLFASKAGFMATEAGSLSDARESLASGSYDVCILDLKLPDGNGLDWISAFKDHSPSMSVIVLTALQDQSMDVKAEAMRRGADDFLTKPITFEEFESSLRKNVRKPGSGNYFLRCSPAGSDRESKPS